jgi:hypothetical protein
VRFRHETTSPCDFGRAFVGDRSANCVNGSRQVQAPSQVEKEPLRIGEAAPLHQVLLIAHPLAALAQSRVSLGQQRE